MAHFYQEYSFKFYANLPTNSVKPLAILTKLFQYNFNKLLFKLIPTILFVAINVEHSYADEDHQFTISQRNHIIGFGGSIEFEVINETSSIANWKLLKNKKIEKSGVGNKTELITFDIPGKYELIFNAINDAQVSLSDTAFIEVQNTKIIFYPERARLNKEPIQNQELIDAYLSIPIKVYSYSNEPAKYGPYTSRSTGIDGISASFNRSESFIPGEHQLQFELTGTPTYYGPAQLGFFSPSGDGFFYNLMVTKKK